jgi:hypothetical protein
VGADRWDEQVGSVADEAARLLESLRRSAAEAAGEASAAGENPDGAHPSGAGRTAPGGSGGTASGTVPPSAAEPGHGPAGAAEHDPVCQWCPICRGAAVVRSLSPETLTRLADLAGVAASVLADLAATRTGGGRETPDAPRRPPAPAPSRPIPVGDADDSQEAPRG